MKDFIERRMKELVKRNSTQKETSKGVFVSECITCVMGEKKELQLSLLLLYTKWCMYFNTGRGEQRMIIGKIIQTQKRNIEATNETTKQNRRRKESDVKKRKEKVRGKEEE